MKISLCTLNAKFIHSSLALRYLQAICSQIAGLDSNIREFTINQLLSEIMAEIYLEQPDVLCFSCYIWNIKPIREICRDYKKVAPETVIILGGPEVSFNTCEFLEQNSSVDIIISGEGEESLPDLLDHLQSGKPLDDVLGVTWNQNGQIIKNPERPLIQNLDTIPSPYTGDLSDLNNRTVYYETSRGCPFNCSYCLSSTIKGVRYFSLARVKNDLSSLIDKGVREIKFVDRTFNCNESRAINIMRFLIEYPGNTRFHFEICAELLSTEILQFLSSVPPHKFDFEIGVQSTFEPALTAVNRKHNWDKLKKNVNQLRSYNNIHLHLDLIAGLPFESYQQFARSFNAVYNLCPDMLQLGFLKLLKGSLIRNTADMQGYRYQEEPPYQILANNFIKYNEIIKLTYIEEVLSRYYNNERVKKTLIFIINNLYKGNSFSFYEDLAGYWKDNGLFGIGHKREARYSFLKEFMDEKYPDYSQEANDLIKYDYLSLHKAYELPAGIKRYNPVNVNDLLYVLLKNNSFINMFLSEARFKPISSVRKNIIMEFFHYNPITGQQMDKAIPFIFVYDPMKNQAYKVIPLFSSTGFLG